MAIGFWHFTMTVAREAVVEYFAPLKTLRLYLLAALTCAIVVGCDLSCRSTDPIRRSTTQSAEPLIVPPPPSVAPTRRP